MTISNLEDILQLQWRIAPEFMEILQRRYDILRIAFYLQPVGRRILSDKLGRGERLIRSDLDFLRGEGLLVTSKAGVELTPEGQDVLEHLAEMFHVFQGIHELEKELAEYLGLEQVILAAGNSDQDQHVKKEMARMAAVSLHKILRPGTILAVAGGTTMAAVAEAAQPAGKIASLEVLPARGGLGEEVEIQANTIAAKLAGKLGAAYRLLFAPDNLSSEALASLHSEKSIRNVLESLKAAEVLLYGIGGAVAMAGRRGIENQEYRKLLDSGAVGEAFGYYFDEKGHIVHASGSIGLQVEDLKEIAHPIAVAGGESKAMAIVAVLSHLRRGVLISDTAAAQKILSGR